MDEHGTGVLTRQRGVSGNAKENQEPSKTAAVEKGGFTAHNVEFDRRRYELRRRLVKDKAAAAEELAVLEHRSEVLKEFLIEVDSASEKLEELSTMLNAEKEFASRMEQLELRYFRAFGKYFSHCGNDNCNAGNGEAPLPPSAGTLFFQAVPYIIGMIVAAAIISAAMAMIFL